MTGVYIASTAGRAGKSLLSFSLGVLLQRAGFSVGYMKPVGSRLKTVDERAGDEDALVVQEVLGQDVPADILTPVISPQNLRGLWLHDRDAGEGNLARISTAYDQISQPHDITLVSGSGSFPATGNFAGVPGLELVKRLNLRVVLIERLDGLSYNYDSLLYCRDLLGPALLGVVLNDVADTDRRDVEQALVPYLESRSIRVLGLIPREPSLWAVRAGDLAQALGGRPAAGSAGAARMVEGFLIGAMQVENFMTYLRRHTNRAVIVGGDRADLQLAALHEKVPCIILTGNLGPGEMVRQKAEALGIPIIAVREDTYTTAQAMSGVLANIKLRELHRIRLGLDLVEASLDLPTLIAAFGLQTS